MSTGNPLVTVVIPSFNAGTFLDDAIASVLRQTYRPIECIVVDDGSSPALEPFKGWQGHPVRVIRQRNQGVANARNTGLREAKGSLVAFLDADDVWLPFKLRQQVERLLSGPSLGFVYSSMFLVNEHLAVVARMDAPTPDEALENTLLLKQPTIFAAQTLLVRREVLDALHGWDERLSVSADMDLGCRLLLKFNGDVCPQQPATLYRRHAGQMHRDLSAFASDTKRVFEKLLSPGSPLAPLREKAEARLHVTLAAANLKQRNGWQSIRELTSAFRCDARTAATTTAELLAQRLLRTCFKR